MLWFGCLLLLLMDLAMASKGGGVTVAHAVLRDVGSVKRGCSPRPLPAGTVSKNVTCRGCGCLASLQGDVSRRPPYFVPKRARCEVRHWDGAAAAGCLRGKRVFIIGNSIARGFFFEALAVYGGKGATAASRDDQKATCSKKSIGYDASCSARIAEADIQFKWFETLSHVVPGVPAEDSCYVKGKTRDCVVRMLNTSVPGDLFIFFLGMHLAYHWDDALAHMPVQDYRAYIRSSAQEWVETVRQAWHGHPADVFRPRITPAQRPWGPRVPAVNTLLDEAFENTGWSVVDSWGMNKGSEKKYYADGLHFPGPLSRAFWNVVLTSFCG